MVHELDLKIDVDEYYDKYKDTTWDCDDGEITLSDFVDNTFFCNYGEYMAGHSMRTVGYWEAALKHEDTVKHCYSVLSEFKVLEKKVPRLYAVVIDHDGNLIDGFHRLVAAKMLDLKFLPAKYNGMQGGWFKVKADGTELDIVHADSSAEAIEIVKSRTPDTDFTNIVWSTVKT